MHWQLWPEDKKKNFYEALSIPAASAVRRTLV